MAVKIRLQRGGATHNPYYRVVVTDSRARRDGRFVERVGSYDPKNKKEDEQLKLQLDRVDYWLSVGAQPSDTVRSLIKRYRRKAPAAAVEAPAPVAAVAPAAALAAVVAPEAVSAAAEAESAPATEPAAE